MATDGNVSDQATTTPPGERRLVLAGRLTINEADARRDELAGCLAECDRLTVDTGGVEAVDVTGLQLLIALRRSAAQGGKTVILAPPPGGALLEALVSAGFRRPDDGAAPGAEQDGFWWGRS